MLLFAFCKTTVDIITEGFNISYPWILYSNQSVLICFLHQFKQKDKYKLINGYLNITG